ncbi:MAG: hypothetical protein ACYDHU_04615 [Acidimicrobiales bacterium]
MTARGWWHIVSAVAPSVLARPGLWPTTAVVVARMARPGWWHAPPFAPVPDSDYWRFRMVTAYGRGDDAPSPIDVVEFLRWYRSGGRRAAWRGATDPGW